MRLEPFALTAALAGCTGTPPDSSQAGSAGTTTGSSQEPTGGSDADTSDGSAEDSSGGSPEDTADAEVDLASLRGRILGPDASPAEGVRATLCHGVCRFADSGPDGTFVFDDVEANSYALHFTVLGDDSPQWADVLVITNLEPGEEASLERDVPMAALGDTAEVVRAGEVQVDAGLWLTVDPATIELPFDADSLDLAAATPATLPPELPTKDVLAVWYLAPFDAKASSGMTLRATNTWGLDPGEEAVLWTSSYTDYAWVEAGRVVTSDDGTEVVGGDIPVVSTLVLGRPAGG